MFLCFVLYKRGVLLLCYIQKKSSTPTSNVLPYQTGGRFGNRGGRERGFPLSVSSVSLPFCETRVELSIMGLCLDGLVDATQFYLYCLSSCLVEWGVGDLV